MSGCDGVMCQAVSALLSERVSREGVADLGALASALCVESAHRGHVKSVSHLRRLRRRHPLPPLLSSVESEPYHELLEAMSTLSMLQK